MFDESTFNAIKKTITGLKLTETTTEYAVDEETGKLKMVKQKVQEKTIPPNTDLIKLIFQQMTESKTNYDELSDEQLEKEKQRLLKELKDDGRTSKDKSKV